MLIRRDPVMVCAGAQQTGVQRLRRRRVMARGTLRIYLGAAPGVGKTYAMLDEGIRRRLSSYT
jgi:K+-sensing histidine kinase KdpD